MKLIAKEKAQDLINLNPSLCGRIMQAGDRVHLIDDTGKVRTLACIYTVACVFYVLN